MGGIKLDGKVLVTVCIAMLREKEKEKNKRTAHNICKTNDTNQKFMAFLLLLLLLLSFSMLSVVVVVVVTSKLPNNSTHVLSSFLQNNIKITMEKLSANFIKF